MLLFSLLYVGYVNACLCLHNVLYIVILKSEKMKFYLKLHHTYILYAVNLNTSVNVDKLE